MGMMRRAFITQEGSTPVAVKYALGRPRRRTPHADVGGRLILNRPINPGAYSLTERGVSRAIHVLECNVKLSERRKSFTASFAAVDAGEWAGLESERR